MSGMLIKPFIKCSWTLGNASAVMNFGRMDLLCCCFYVIFWSGEADRFFVATCLWINLVWRRIHNIAQSKICDPWSHTCVGQMATLGRLLSMPCSLLKALEKIDDTWWFRSIYTQVSSTIDQLWYDLYWSYLYDPFLHNFVRSSLCNDSTSCERMNMHEPSKYWGTPMT
jgi:hypothetical protein